jgi:hypothetical protein
MPHDKNGRVIVAGDVVNIPCTVRDVQQGEEFCNVNLETIEPMFPRKDRSVITLNARQVELVVPPKQEQ